MHAYEKHNIKAREWVLTLKQTCCRDFPYSAICVQRFDDSLNSAIHITYRSSLRSSSMHEPRDPPLKVVVKFSSSFLFCYKKEMELNVKDINLVIESGFNTLQDKLVWGSSRPLLRKTRFHQKVCSTCANKQA